MYEFVGYVTGKVYATGTKADCFRKLDEEFLNWETSEGYTIKGRINPSVYPEPIIIREKIT